MKQLLIALMVILGFLAVPHPSQAQTLPTPHSVTLNWTQSTTPGITGNGVYRATVSGGPYMLLTTLAPATTYTDTAVIASTTYYYVVTALAGTAESGYSNQATVTVPATTISPTNLKAVAQ